MSISPMFDVITLSESISLHTLLLPIICEQLYTIVSLTFIIWAIIYYCQFYLYHLSNHILWSVLPLLSEQSYTIVSFTFIMWAIIYYGQSYLYYVSNHILLWVLPLSEQSYTIVSFTFIMWAIIYYCQSYLYYVSKISSLNIVVSFNEDFSKSAFSYWVVFRIEFVKTMECIPIL